MATIGTGTFTWIVKANYAAGTYSIPAVTLTAPVAHVLLQVDRTDWASFEGSISLVIEYSSDGGVVWRPVGGLATTCGPCTYDGVAQNNVSSDFAVPNVGQAGRQLRGSTTVNGATKGMGVTAVVT